MRKGIVIGSRGSKLALIQAESVAAKIKGRQPYLKMSIVKIVTRGDSDRHTQLDRMGASAFVKELEDALLNNKIDMAVHSLKDMPTSLPQGLCLLAVTERDDHRDVLISRSGRLNELPPGSKIGTGSLRRAVQLAHCRADIEVCSIRGNVDTRLRKVYSGGLDGIITSAAAMIRLQLEEKITEYLSLEYFLPSAGQGAIAVEARLDDEEIAGLVSPVNCADAWQSTMAERAFLNTLDCGCRAPIAALGTITGSRLRLEGMIAGTTSKQILRASEEGSPDSPEEIGVRLAQRMIEMGAFKLIREDSGK